MPAKLTLNAPERASRVVVIRDGESLQIGRDFGCDLVLEDSSVSRHHARLGWNGSGWTLVDVGSKNGTTVNGEPHLGGALDPRQALRDEGRGLGGGEMLEKAEQAPDSDPVAVPELDAPRRWRGAHTR